MTKKEFFEFVGEELAHTMDVLEVKSVYNDPNDYFSYFDRVGALLGSTSEEALFALMSKHIISIADLCKKSETDFNIWQEKLTDTINYLLLLGGMEKEKCNEQN